MNNLKQKLLTVILLIVSASIQAQVHTIIDMGGRKVSVPVKINKVYVDKHCAQMVYAIAPEKTVNSVFKLTDGSRKFLSKDWENKPYTEGATEEIIRLHPDVVLMADELSPQTIDKANKLQSQIKIPVVLVELNMLKYKNSFKFLGDILSKQSKAIELISFIRNYLDKIQARARLIPAKEKVHVYYAEGPNGLSTDPSGSKHSQIIDFVGAVNVAKTGILSGKGMSAVSMEQIMIWNPQVILVWTGSAENLITYKYILSDPLWKNLNPVKNNRVYQIPWLPFGWFDRPPGTSRIMGTIWTANLLYPQIFKFDMIKITQEYFNKFYHCNLSTTSAKALLSPKPY